jgi:superfamily II DNA or RNA helicase
MITSFKQIEKLSGIKLTQRIGFGKYKDKHLWEIPSEYIEYMSNIGACNLQATISQIKKAKEIYTQTRIDKAQKTTLQKFDKYQISDYILKDADTVKRNAAQVRELLRFNGKSNIIINGCIGSGKTIIGIENIKLYSKPGDKTLIVCPISVFNSVWVDKIKKFHPEKSYHILTDKIADRIDELNNINVDIYITNPDALRNENYLIALCRKGFTFAFFDEAHLYLSNHSSATYKHCKILIESIPHNWPLTGSFITDGREWKAVDIAYAFGIFNDSISAVYRRYFNFDNYYKPCSVKNGMYEELMTILGNNSMTILESELELPEPIFETREVLIEGDIERAYYQAIREQVINIKDTEIGIPAKIAELTRLRQISGGTMSIKDDKGQIIKRHRYKDNNKIKEVYNIVSEFKDDDKFIIICQYTEEIEMMKKEFPGCAIISGQEKRFDDFINRDTRTLVMQLDTAIGIDGLQDVCRYMIFYSNTYSFEKFRQAYGRIYRSGTLTNAVIYFIHAVLQTGQISIDQAMNETRTAKKENRDDCLNFIWERVMGETA